MDISNATALTSTIVDLIAPALIQTLKKHIPEDFTSFTALGVSLLAQRHRHRGHQRLHRIRVASYLPRSLAWHKPCTRW